MPCRMRAVWPLVGLGALLLCAVRPAQAEEAIGSLTEWFAVHGAAAPGPGPQAPAPAPPIPGLNVYSSRTAFNQAAPGLPVEDFEEGNVPPSSVVPCPSPLDNSSSNSCFAPGDILPGIRFQANPNANPADGIALVGPGLVGATSKGIVANYFVETFDIIFIGGGVNAVGMDLLHYFSSPVTVTITVYGSGSTVLGVTAASATSAGQFWGVISQQPITSINIASTVGPSGDGAEGVDNVAFGTTGVPAPLLRSAGVAMVAVVLLGIGVLALRRKLAQ